MRKQFPWFEIVLTVVFLGANVYAAFSDPYNFPNRWFIRDDAYYYFKVSQNISEGRGSTFDGIHPTNGYHPLWLLICVPIFALARFDLILPLRVLVLLTGVLQIATTLLLYRLVRSAISPPAGMLMAVYWAFNSYILVFLYKTGVESIIALFFIALLLYQLQGFERRWRAAEPRLRELAWLGLLATLAVFSRLDLVFFAIVIGIWIVFRESPLRYLPPLDVLALLTSTVVAFIARLGLLAYYDVSGLALIMAGIAILANIPAAYALGLYDPPSTWRWPRLLRNILLSTALTTFVLALVLLPAGYLHLLPAFSPVIILMNAAISFGLLLFIRLATFAFHDVARSAPTIPPLDYFRHHWKAWLREGSVYYGILGGALSLYMVWNKLAFGSFSPVSGNVKRWWGTFAISIYGGPAKSWLSFFALNPNGDFNAWGPFSRMFRQWSNEFLFKYLTRIHDQAAQDYFLVLLGLLAAAFCAFLLLRKKKAVKAVVQAALIPLFVGSWLQILSYNVTGYASLKEWYWLTEQILMTISAALLLDVFWDILFKRWIATRVLMWAVVVYYGVRTGWSYLGDTYALMPHGQTPANAAYADMLPFLERATQPGDVIGMTGGGTVAYFLPDRTIVNMDGLINSNAYFQALKAGTGSDYLYDTGMRYVFANPGLLDAIPYHHQYDNRLKLIRQWGGKDLMRLLPDPSP